MAASKPPPLPPICLAFVRIVAWILLPGLGLAYAYRGLTSILGEWPSFLLSGFFFFFGGPWVASPLLASSSLGRLLVTTAALCACGVLILLKLLFLFVVIIVGSLHLAGQAVNRRGVPALLRDIFRSFFPLVLAISSIFLKRSSSLRISQPQTARRDAVRENPNLRKLFVHPDIIPPPPPRGTGCSTKLDIFRGMDNEVNNAAHRRMEDIRYLKEKFRAADAESVERIAAAKRFLDQRMAKFEAREAQAFPVPEPGETTAAIVAQAATLRDRLGLDDYADINNVDETLEEQVTMVRMRFEQSYMAAAIRRLKKTVEERDNTIRKQAEKFVAFKDGVRDMRKRWEKTFDTLEEKLKKRDAEIDGLKRAISVKNDNADRDSLKAKAKRRGHLCSHVDACVCRVHQSFKESDLFQEAAQRQFRRDHRATLARPFPTPSPSGSSSSVNTSAAEETVKSIRAGKRRILRPATNYTAYRGVESAGPPRASQYLLDVPLLWPFITRRFLRRLGKGCG